MANLSVLTKKFSRELCKEFEAGRHILDCFDMYMGFLKCTWKEKEIQKMTGWQYEDMRLSIYNQKIDYSQTTLETAWKCCRRSSKTLRASLLAVFYNLLGKKDRWFTPASGQMAMAFEWFHKNPFVSSIKTIDHLIHIVNEAYPIQYNVLKTFGTVTGDECDCLFYDEGGWILKDQVTYTMYHNSRPFIVNSDFAHILQFSTPARRTAFAEAWDALKNLEEQLQTSLTIERDWNFCPWIKKDRVLYEADVNQEVPWFVDQNYRCLDVVYGGAVFTNYYDLHDQKAIAEGKIPPNIETEWGKLEATHGGVDWNGEHTQHYLVLIAFTDRFIFVLREYKFLDLSFLQQFDHEVSLELEQGDQFERSNMFTIDATQMGIECRLFGWDKYTKAERVRRVKHRTVIIDKIACPQTWRNFQEASYDKNSRELMLEKRQDQHGLDCVLHAMHIEEGDIYVSRKKEKRDLFGQPKTRQVRI